MSATWDKIDIIADRYWDEDESSYSPYYYDEDDCEFCMQGEIERFLRDSGFEYNINEIDAFDSCGYSCSVLCVSWIENGKLGTYNILLEVR